MATSSVPTAQELIDAFPETPSPHTGAPTYLSLKSLRDTLKANASSVKTLGGGVHGHLGVILPHATYNAIVAPTVAGTNSFIDPPFPGATPNIPANLTAHSASLRRDRWNANMKTWQLNKNINDALRKQIIASVGEIYIRPLKHQHTAYPNSRAQDMLEYLFDNYGIITAQDLQQNNNKFYEQFDSSEPFETLVARIEDCLEFANDGNQPFSDTQVLNNAYNLIFNCGLYFDECKTWNQKAIADKTWANFKTHFLEAQRLQRLQRTANQQGYFSHILND